MAATTLFCHCSWSARCYPAARLLMYVARLPHSFGPENITWHDSRLTSRRLAFNAHLHLECLTSSSHGLANLANDRSSVVRGCLGIETAHMPACAPQDAACNVRGSLTRSRPHSTAYGFLARCAGSGLQSAVLTGHRIWRLEIWAPHHHKSTGAPCDQSVQP